LLNMLKQALQKLFCCKKKDGRILKVVFKHSI
jgi:hypothetical protein